MVIVTLLKASGESWAAAFNAGTFIMLVYFSYSKSK
jgi:hypothetical protein